MASTNPFQHVDADAIDGVNESIVERGARERQRSRRSSGRAAGRRGKRAKARKQALRDSMKHGWPEWEGLRPVMTFMLFPFIMALGVVLTGPWPLVMLYGFAGLLGLYVFYSAFRGVELVLACMVLYLPFSTTYVIPVAPGVNGTNMLILLGLFASVMRAVDERQGWLAWPRGTTTVFIFGFLSCISAFTVMREPGGYAWLMYNNILNYKAWVDQFILYFIALSCVRSIDVAKRMVLYMGIGAVILVLYSVPEMLDKMGNSSIEKSRIGGPLKQPNNFGGLVAYTVLPLVAIFVTYIKDIRAWILTPYFLIALKVLITTFSRGAYVAMAVGGFMAAYYKGKGFLFFWTTVALCFFLLFPSMIPDAVTDRMFGSKDENSIVVAAGPETMDKSSESRLILWRAGGKMILENPILGKGFKGFTKLKAQYTEREVRESDPHSTYIYIASQMGLPALVLFLLILGYSFHLGRTLSRNKDDLFIRAIGIGGASATVCYSVICVFGSRAVNLEFTAYFWVYFVCMQVIDMQLRKQAEKPKKRRTNAFEARPMETLAGDEDNLSADSDKSDQNNSAEKPRALLPSPKPSRIKKRARSDLAAARARRSRLKPQSD